jgi:hypothetical protein
MVLDGIDDEAVVVAVDSGLHQHAALEASRPVHREVIFQEHRWWGESRAAARGYCSSGPNTWAWQSAALGGSFNDGLRTSSCGPAHIAGSVALVYGPPSGGFRFHWT